MARKTADRGISSTARSEPEQTESDSDRRALAGIGSGLFYLLGHEGPKEKEKVSVTLDRDLVEEIRSHTGPRGLSTSINELLYRALAQERLGELVEEMEREAGPASPEAYERVLAQWFAEE